MTDPYIDRIIKTVRQHKDSPNAWPEWANVLADEVERLEERLSVYEDAIVAAKYGRALVTEEQRLAELDEVYDLFREDV